MPLSTNRVEIAKQSHTLTPFPLHPPPHSRIMDTFTTLDTFDHLDKLDHLTSSRSESHDVSVSHADVPINYEQSNGACPSPPILCVIA